MEDPIIVLTNSKGDDLYILCIQYLVEEAQSSLGEVLAHVP